MKYKSTNICHNILAVICLSTVERSIQGSVSKNSIYVRHRQLFIFLCLVRTGNVPALYGDLCTSYNLCIIALLAELSTANTFLR
jgi:hypothetical protein